MTKSRHIGHQITTHPGGPHMQDRHQNKGQQHTFSMPPVRDNQTTGNVDREYSS